VGTGLLAISIVLPPVSVSTLIEPGLFVVANRFSRKFPGRLYAADEDRPLQVHGFSVLASANDERRHIPRRVDGILAPHWRANCIEVMIIADDRSDGSAVAAAGIHERGDGMLRGKGASPYHEKYSTMHAGNDTNMIVDTDSAVPVDILRAMSDVFASGKNALRAVDQPHNVDAANRMRRVRLSLISVYVFCPIRRDLCDFSKGILGDGLMLRKEVLREAPYAPNSFTEDLENYQESIEGGEMLLFALDAAILSDFPVSVERIMAQLAHRGGRRLLLRRRIFPPSLVKVSSGRLLMQEPSFEVRCMPLDSVIPLPRVLTLVPGQQLSPFAAIALVVVLLQAVLAAAFYWYLRGSVALLENPAYAIWRIAKLPSAIADTREGAAWLRAIYVSKPALGKVW
jgi:hypothetical protein